MTTPAFRFSIGDAMKLAERKANIAGWKAYRWRALDDDPTSFDSLVTGCVPDGVHSRGKHKGLPRFSKPKPGTVREIAVTTAELTAQAKQYALNTLQCWDCKGQGKTVIAHSARTGATYGTCPRCNGSRIDPTAEARAA
jgi:hypothetical protein